MTDVEELADLRLTIDPGGKRPDCWIPTGLVHKHSEFLLKGGVLGGDTGEQPGHLVDPIGVVRMLVELG